MILNWIDTFSVSIGSWNSALHIYFVSYNYRSTGQAMIRFKLKAYYTYAINTGSVKQSFPSPPPANIRLPVNPPTY